MLKYFSVVCIFFLLCLDTRAQTNATPKVLVLTDSISGDFIGDYYYSFKEGKQRVSIDSVAHPSFNRFFEPSNLKRSNFGNREYSVWNKFTVTNQTDHEWLFDIGVYTIDTLIVYYPNNDGSFRVVNSGRYSPFHEKKYKSNSFLFDLDIPKGDTVTIFFWLRAHIMQYPTQVYHKNDYINIAHDRDILSGLFIGLFLVMIFYNLFIWISTRDSDYLFYTANILLGAVYIFQINGIANEYLFLGFLHHFDSHGASLVAIASVADVAFAIKFLEARKHTPKIYLFLRYGLIPAYILVCAFDLFQLKLMASLANQTLGLLAILFMVMAGIYSYRKGLHSARYFLLAKGFYFLGAVLFILKTFAVLPFNNFYNNSLEAGMAMQMVFFSFALAGKINQSRYEQRLAELENQRLIEEQNVVLEHTVKERTKELQSEKELTEELLINVMEQKKEVEKEKQRSDELLLNILPEKVAEELKQTGSAQAVYMDEVTVLFTDFEGFTKYSENLPPAELVSEINECFSVFDRIMEKHNVEKIKTIGDSYMAAGGLPSPNKTHALDVIHAALELQQFMEEHKKAKTQNGKGFFQMRMGVHTGPVVAGIVGVRKFAYDIWGDTVNTASRVESNGVVGKINISSSTYEHIKDVFECTYRGKIAAKGKGEIDMYFVNTQS